MNEFELLKLKVEELERAMITQDHNGINGQLVSLQNLTGLFSTVTVAPTRTPTNVYEQIVILNNAGTYSLYVYDAVGNVWKSVTIS